MPHHPGFAEINVRMAGSHEYALVPAIELSPTCASIFTFEGGYDVVLTLPGMACGFDFRHHHQSRLAVLAIEQAGIFTGDPDVAVIFERNGGRNAFLEKINSIGRSIKENTHD